VTSDDKTSIQDNFPQEVEEKYSTQGDKYNIATRCEETRRSPCTHTHKCERSEHRRSSEENLNELTQRE
jgi:hypothetical protein